MTSRTTARFWDCYRELPQVIQAILRFDSSLSETVNGLCESACTIAPRVVLPTDPFSSGTGSALMRSMTGWLEEGEY
jgi:hypothetical protein